MQRANVLISLLRPTVGQETSLVGLVISGLLAQKSEGPDQTARVRRKSSTFVVCVSGHIEDSLHVVHLLLIGRFPPLTYRRTVV